MESFDLRKWHGFVASGGNNSDPAWIDQIVIDSRRIHSSRSLFVALPGNNLDGHRFVQAAANAGAKYALVLKEWNPSYSCPHLTLLRVENPLSSFQEIAKAYRNSFACKVIAITGSYGKTMVKDLLYTLLSTTQDVVASPESFNSQIGVPLSLLTIKKDTKIALIEAAVSQVGEMDRLANMIQADCCILTHAGRKHIHTLGSMENSVSEMMKLAKQISAEGWVLLPKNPLLLSHLEEIRAQKRFWNEAETGLPFVQRVAEVLALELPDRSEAEEIIFPGQDYYVDLLNLALKPAWLLGLSSSDILRTIRAYIPQPMRTEIWQSPFGTTFINEPYSSDPQSIDRSLNQFKLCPPNGKKIFLFGGLRSESSDQSHDYTRIGQAIVNASPDRVLLVGSHPYKFLMAEVEKKESPPIIFSQHATYKEAIEEMREQLKPQDLVLIKGDARYPLDDLTETFHGSICPNQCFINLAAIEANLATISQKLGKSTRLMIMVKAYAYGMNDVRIAQFLTAKGIDILGVSYVDEGIIIKRAGIAQNIFSLHASPYEAKKVVEWGLEVGVSDRTVIAALGEASRQRQVNIKVHLHVDTGMNRLGCRPEEALSLAQEILSYSTLKLEGVMTHFSSADDSREDGYTLKQIERFTEVIETLKGAGIDIPWIHAANSSGMMRFSFPQCNMARIGLSLYGLSPSKEASEALDLRPAISLTSRIVGINQCKKGDSVSYGRQYIVDQDQKRIAVIPIGYYDGIHRNYSGKGIVIIHGKRAPIVGHICMDFMMVDISDIPKASINDPVLLFGEDSQGNRLAPEEFASLGNSIPHELITCLGPRIQRIFIHEETQKSC